MLCHFFIFRVNGGVQFGTGGPNGLQNNNLLMTVILGLGVISFLSIVTNIVSPLLKPSKDDAAKPAATPAANATTPAAAARSLPEMIDLANQVYTAIESLGKEFKQE